MSLPNHTNTDPPGPSADTRAPAAKQRSEDASGAPELRSFKEPAGLADIAREIDSRLCSLHRLSDTLRERVDDTRHEGAPSLVNIERIEERAGYIAAMRHLHAELQKLLVCVARNGAAADALHKTEIRAAQEGLSRAQSRAEPVGTEGSARCPGAPRTPPDAQGPLLNGGMPWGPGASEGAPRMSWSKAVGMAAAPSALRDPRATATPPLQTPFAPKAKGGAPPVGAGPSVGPSGVPVRRPVRVVGEIAVEAVVVPASLRGAREILAAVAPGDLHYVPQWNHFALRVGGCVLHANLGRIYRGAPPRSAGPVEREMPERVKECHKARCPAGAGGCRYYHDPEEHPGSSDTRNYAADSWLYVPASSPARSGARRFGSADHLEADLRVIGAEEARRFMSQTAHDVLCSVILWAYVLAPRGARGPTGARHDSPKSRRLQP